MFRESRGENGENERRKDHVITVMDEISMFIRHSVQIMMILLFRWTTLEAFRLSFLASESRVSDNQPFMVLELL